MCFSVYLLQLQIASEDFFTLTDVVNRKRNKLKGETTHKCIFLNHNLYLIPEYTKNKYPNKSQEDNKPRTSQGNQENEDENISDADKWWHNLSVPFSCTFYGFDIREIHRGRNQFKVFHITQERSHIHFYLLKV